MPGIKGKKQRDRYLTENNHHDSQLRFSHEWTTRLNSEKPGSLQAVDSWPVKTGRSAGADSHKKIAISWMAASILKCAVDRFECQFSMTGPFNSVSLTRGK